MGFLVSTGLHPSRTKVLEHRRTLELSNVGHEWEINKINNTI
jgi:hypothetical protein